MSVRLIEVELRVADVARSRRFYRDLVGVPVGDLERHAADGEAHAHATWGEWSPEPSLVMLNIYPARSADVTTQREAPMSPRPTSASRSRTSTRSMTGW